jgi:hypothetical protein
MPELEWEVESTPDPAPPGVSAAATSVEPLRTFRDAIRIKSPPWLQRGLAEKILYAIAIHLDGFADALTAAVKMRFPGRYSMESLPLIGRDRRIRRGRNETDAVYASRLLRWLDDHATRGGPYAMLAQLHAHFAPDNFEIHLVYRSGRRFQMDADGVIEMDDLFSINVPDWAKWTLYYFTSFGATIPKWGDPGRTWGDGQVWGSTLTPPQVTDLRLVPREWNAAHPIGTIVLLGDSGQLWGYPQNVWGAPGLKWGGKAIRLKVG